MKVKIKKFWIVTVGPDHRFSNNLPKHSTKEEAELQVARKGEGFIFEVEEETNPDTNKKRRHFLPPDAPP